MGAVRTPSRTRSQVNGEIRGKVGLSRTRCDRLTAAYGLAHRAPSRGVENLEERTC